MRVGNPRHRRLEVGATPEPGSVVYATSVAVTAAPALFVGMKAPFDAAWLPTHLDRLFQRLAESPGASTPFSGNDCSRILQAGFAHVLKGLLEQEREFHLAADDADRANGHAPARTFWIDEVPVGVRRPLTRRRFYPALLPKHQRFLPYVLQKVLIDALMGAKNPAASRRVLRMLGSRYSASQIDQLALTLSQSVTQFFRRPLDSHWQCLLVDTGAIESAGDHRRPARGMRFLVVGRDLAGRTDLLSAATFRGASTENGWRKILADLKTRGVLDVRKLIAYGEDNPPPLAPVVRELFINCDYTYLQSRRDCATKPRIASSELPWVNTSGIGQPQRGCGFD